MNGMQFDYVREDNSQWKIRLPLTGAYQAANAACALKVIEVLKEKTFPQLTLSVIQNGFQKVCWNGRFERVLEEPLCILDGAHNEGAALQLAKTLENCFTNRKITYIIGVLADKAHEKILEIMRPYSETVYAVTPHNGRALPAEKLAEEAKAAGYQTVITEPLIEDAVRHAIAESSREDVVLIFGSLSYLAEAKQAVIQYREGDRRMIDKEKVEAGVRLILEGIGEDVNREGLLETPDRIARMYEEIFGGMDMDAAEPLKKRFHASNNEMVVEKDITFYSTCEHHMLPFYGKAHVAYIPNGEVVGISKLARTVEIYARRLQIQEQLTAQVADALMEQLKPKGVMVMMEAEHMCMTMRGIKKPGSRTVTYVTRGIFNEDERLVNKFFQMVR